MGGGGAAACREETFHNCLLLLLSWVSHTHHLLNARCWERDFQHIVLAAIWLLDLINVALNFSFRQCPGPWTIHRHIDQLYIWQKGPNSSIEDLKSDICICKWKGKVSSFLQRGTPKLLNCKSQNHFTVNLSGSCFPATPTYPLCSPSRPCISLCQK